MTNKAIMMMAGCILALPALAQKKYTINAPDKTLSVQVTVSDSIYYQVMRNGNVLTEAAALSFTTDQNAAGFRVSKAMAGTHSGILTPVVWQKAKTIADDYSSLRLDFSNKLSMEWRVYKNGIAWRWINNLAKACKVTDELATLNPGPEARAWYPQEDGFFSHNERQYRKYRVGDIDAGKLASLPVLFETKGAKLLLTESGLFNYAGMWVQGDGKGSIRGVFPHYPREKKIEGDRSELVVSREDFIAKIKGPQNFPWRIVMVAKDDGELLTNQLPYLLGTPPAPGSDYSWVKPGKVQWDWWHYNNIYNVNFRAGINNDTYKYYIDFAAKYHLEYVLLDEGWCDTRDLFKQSKHINIEELAAYAHSRNVGLLLWTSWLVLDQQLDRALDQFEKWGIKGIKVDFMQRDDQDMVNYYEKVSKAAASHKLMVDFHGACKPTGWSRTYPNVMTSEGVLGNEISKFSDVIDPEHTLTIPFIRMAAGPMDFTPGGMLNVQKNAFAAQPAEPMTLGTRCNQMAMYVMYESPLQMLCDIPTHYYREPECMEFLQAVPAVWQQTIPLTAAIGEYAAIARQAANGDWFIGAMTNWTAREITVDLSFLGDGKYKMHIWKDGLNADRKAKDFAMDTIEADKSSALTIKMAPGGGYVARLVKE
ncbi:alpha-glucosidase [Niastella vici]|uniref:Alpha-glucosidase n=2 Tax=Niastella vici TaxID=1703345 RepID=A0A1V9G0N5_9BACT|nr:alpha-glucosidase [Niastella vici]